MLDLIFWKDPAKVAIAGIKIDQPEAFRQRPHPMNSLDPSRHNTVILLCYGLILSRILLELR